MIWQSGRKFFHADPVRSKAGCPGQDLPSRYHPMPWDRRTIA